MSETKPRHGRVPGGAGSATRAGRLPDFLIIGAMRSGTSSLAHYLTGHPDVFMAKPKELHFFNAAGQYDKGLNWYRAQFQGAGERRAAGEATPTYMRDPVAIERIAQAMPTARLIAILRSPVDRAYSHYLMNRAKNQEPLSFERALEAERDEIAAGSSRTHAPYFSTGLYLEQLERVAAGLPDAPLLVLLMDDLSADPAGTFSRVLGFLEVADIPVPSVGRHVNRYVEFRSLRVRRIARRIPKPLQRVVGRLNTRAAGSYPPMTPEVRAALHERYAEANAALAERLGRDLSMWRV